MAFTDTVVEAASSSSSDPRSCPCGRHRLRRRRRRRSPRRATARGINSTLVVQVAVIVVLSVAALLAPFENLNLNNFNTLNLIVGVDAVVELTTSLGGSEIRSVKSQPALFGVPFAPGESYRHYLFLPPGDDRDKFLCGTRNRDRRLRRGRRNLRRRGRPLEDGNDDAEGDLSRAERRKAMEEAAGDLYRAVTGLEPPDIVSSLSSWGSMGEHHADDDDEGRRSARGMPNYHMRSLNGTDIAVANVNATGNATQTTSTTQTNTTGTDSDSIPDPDPDPTNPDNPNDPPATSTGGSNPPAPGTPPADLPLALLVSRGGSSSESGSGGSSCSFEAKARNAMDLNDVFHMYIMGAEDPMSGNHPLVRIESLIVHDFMDNTRDADRLVPMEATSRGHNDIDLRLVFVSTRSGIYLRRAVEEDAKARRAYASSGGSDGNTGAGSLAWRQNAYLSGAHFTSYRDRPESTWTLPPPPVVTVDGVGALPTPQSPQGGSQAENDNDGNNGNQQPSSSSSSSSTSSLSTFILYFLVSVIAAAAISRLMMLWFEGGGRIRFRRNPNTHRRVGLRVVSAERGWWRGAARRDLQAGDGGGGRGQEGEVKHKMSTEEVMALPEIEYRGCAEVNVENPSAAAGGSSSLLLSSGESGSVRRLSASPRRISFSLGRGLFRTSSSSSFPAPAHRRGSAPSPCPAFPQASSPSSAMRHCSSALCLASFSSVAASPIDSSATIEGTPAAAATTAVADDNSDDQEQTQEEEEISSSNTCCTACSICIEDFERGEKIRLLPRCRHAFHTECILPWLTERQGCCPLCKTRVLLREDADKEQHEDEDDEEQNQEEEGDIVVESSSEHEERAVELVELPQTSQPDAGDDDSGSSIGIRIEASAVDAESGENDGIFQGDATDDGTSDIP